MIVEKGGRISTSNDIRRRVLLAVDDSQSMPRMYARILMAEFDEVLTANTPKEAEQLLRSNEVTHIICDYDLGKDEPTGVGLLSKWRIAYPTIVRAILITGTDLSLIDKTPPEIDSLIIKPIDPKNLKDEIL